MSFWKKLGSLFGGAAGGDASAMHFGVRCSRCGEIVQVRADRRWDLEQDFDPDGDDVAGYTLHKEVLGQRCSQLMRIEVRYDRSYREVSRAVEGGEFVAAPD